MSGDDKSMGEILREIREIVAEDEKNSPENPPTREDMSPGEILAEIRGIVAEDEDGESARGTVRPGERDIRSRRKAMLVSIGGAVAGMVPGTLILVAAGMPGSWLNVGFAIGLFAGPLGFTARTENGRHVAILMGAGLAMPIAAFSALGLVLSHAPPVTELAPIEQIAVPLLASIAALAAGLAGWFAVRWLTRGESLWKRPEAEEGDAG